MKFLKRVVISLIATGGFASFGVSKSGEKVPSDESASTDESISEKDKEVINKLVQKSREKKQRPGGSWTMA